MKKKLLTLILGAVFCVSSAIGLAACNSGGNAGSSEPENLGSWTVKSPDGSIVSEMVTDAEGKTYYSVKKDGKTVVGKSALGLDIEEDDLSLTTIQKESNKKIKGSYDNISGKTDHVEYNGNETTVTYKAWEFYLDITMRVYNDG